MDLQLLKLFTQQVDLQINYSQIHLNFKNTLKLLSNNQLNLKSKAQMPFFLFLMLVTIVEEIEIMEFGPLKIWEIWMIV